MDKILLFNCFLTEEGDDCVTDQKGQPLHEYICGPGLGCDDETNKCVPRELRKNLFSSLFILIKKLLLFYYQ